VFLMTTKQSKGFVPPNEASLYSVVEVFRGDLSAGQQIPMIFWTDYGEFLRPELTSDPIKSSPDVLSFFAEGAYCQNETGFYYPRPAELEPVYTMNLCGMAQTPWSEVSEEDREFFRTVRVLPVQR